MAIDATTDLLVTQWATSGNLRGIIQAYLDVLEEYIIAPLEYLETHRTIDGAEGVWLRYIGERLGLPIPSVDAPTNMVFGFATNNVGFDQGLIYDDEIVLEKQPISNVLYRKYLKARAVSLLARGDTPVFESALSYIDPNAYVVDAHNMSMRVHTELVADVELAIVIGSIPKTAGVGVTVTNLQFFGFATNDVGFDQGRIFDGP